MSVVRVKSSWLNPDKVIGIWHEEILAYRDNPAYWRVTLRCEEGQVWYFKHETEEDAVRDADEIAEQVNGGPKFKIAQLPSGAEPRDRDLR